MTSDPRSGEPFPPAAAPDDVTSAYPVTPAPVTSAPGAPAPAAPASAPMWAAPAQAGQPAQQPAGSDPFDRPAAMPVDRPAPMPVEAPIRGRGNGGMLVNVLLGVALVVAVGGVAFAVGRVTAPTATETGRTGLGPPGGFFQGGPNASGAPAGGFGAAFGGASIQGTVTAVGADSITVQLTSGQTLTIPTDAKTTYRQSTSTTAAAVTSGSTVVVELQGGRGAFGNGNGNGNGGQGGGPNASGAPGRTLGPATTVTVIPSGS